MEKIPSSFDYVCCCLPCTNKVFNSMLCKDCNGWCQNCLKCYKHCERNGCLTAENVERIAESFEIVGGGF